MNTIRSRSRWLRRGAVAVEFAIVAPMFAVITLSAAQVGKMCETSTLLASALRQGARVAAMDRDGFLSQGQNTNTKIIADIKNFLSSSGIPSNQVTVTIKNFENPSQDFDLDSASNDLKLFKVTVQITTTPGGTPASWQTSSLVMRNARAAHL